MSSIHTLYPSNRVDGFLTDQNAAVISKLVTETLAKIYRQKVVVTPDSIWRTMQRINEERVETIPQMNRRVALDLLREIQNEFDETERANYLMFNYWNQYNWDPILGIRPYEKPKLKSDAISSYRSKDRAFHFHFTF